MSKISPFPLPSEPSKKIRFRAPTVDDCLDFSDLRPELEEAAATDYLRQLQVGEVSDPGLWTAQDRISALWWIYVSITEDTGLVYSYECPHCGGRHTDTVDLVELDDRAVSLNREPFVEGVVVCNGKEHPAKFVPLNGYAMMALEEKRLELDGATEAEVKRIKAEIKVMEVVYSFRLDEHKDLPPEDAAALRLSMVHAMDAASEYRPLVAKCLLAANELRHGLDCEITDGELSLISPPLRCEDHKEEEGPAPATVLLMRFRNHYFIPAV
ncbi:hypothetical protein JFQ88_004057 [Aeromonas dhakensis]|nr:hypothetical protein [Aeromonas dhakensis]